MRLLLLCFVVVHAVVCVVVVCRVGLIMFCCLLCRQRHHSRAVEVDDLAADRTPRRAREAAERGTCVCVCACVSIAHVCFSVRSCRVCMVCFSLVLLLCMYVGG